MGGGKGISRETTRPRPQPSGVRREQLGEEKDKLVLCPKNGKILSFALLRGECTAESPGGVLRACGVAGGPSHPTHRGTQTSQPARPVRPLSIPSTGTPILSRLQKCFVRPEEPAVTPASGFRALAPVPKRRDTAARRPTLRGQLLHSSPIRQQNGEEKQRAVMCLPRQIGDSCHTPEGDSDGQALAPKWCRGERRGDPTLRSAAPLPAFSRGRGVKNA